MTLSACKVQFYPLKYKMSFLFCVQFINRIKKFYLSPIAIKYRSQVFEFISQLFHVDSIL